MKHIFFSFTAGSVLAFALLGADRTAQGQAVQTITTAPESVQATTTTTSAGTISEFNPQAIIVKTDSAATPVSYAYSKTTTYVDEDGNPVSLETVKSGLPVTVYYEKDGDNLVASKVIVRKSVSVPAASVQESKSTTTTTTTDK
jgi:hypothetical protein